jgi:hypothetical protein
MRRYAQAPEFKCARRGLDEKLFQLGALFRLLAAALVFRRAIRIRGERDAHLRRCCAPESKHDAEQGEIKSEDPHVPFIALRATPIGQQSKLGPEPCPDLFSIFFT